MTSSRPTLRFLTCGLSALFLAVGCSGNPEQMPQAEAAAERAPVDPATRVHVSDASEPRAIELAQSVVEASGGWDAWDATRYVRWNFFGRRYHHWDRATGDLRIDTEDKVILMNVGSKEGRVFENGAEVTDEARKAEALQAGHEMWINDAYWMFLPFKLLDPGVTLTHGGEKPMEDGRIADVLVMTFEGVGYTPQNKYELFVPQDSGLIEAWAFYADAADTEPRFNMPWKNWETFGGIRLATDHGRGADWDIAVFDELPGEFFTDPTPVIEPKAPEGAEG